jgi:hypothetical protein
LDLRTIQCLSKYFFKKKYYDILKRYSENKYIIKKRGFLTSFLRIPVGSYSQFSPFFLSLSYLFSVKEKDISNLIKRKIYLYNWAQHLAKSRDVESGKLSNLYIFGLNAWLNLGV